MQQDKQQITYEKTAELLQNQPEVDMMFWNQCGRKNLHKMELLPWCKQVLTCKHKAKTKWNTTNYDLVWVSETFYKIFKNDRIAPD